MYVCMYVCMYVYIYVYMYILLVCMCGLDLRAEATSNDDMEIHEYACIYIRMYACVASTSSCILMSYEQRAIHDVSHVCVCTAFRYTYYIYMYVYIYIYISVYIYIYYTYVCIYIYIYINE